MIGRGLLVQTDGCCLFRAISLSLAGMGHFKWTSYVRLTQKERKGRNRSNNSNVHPWGCSRDCSAGMKVTWGMYSFSGTEEDSLDLGYHLQTLFFFIWESILPFPVTEQHPFVIRIILHAACKIRFKHK